MKNTVVKASAALATAVTLSLSFASLALAAPGGPTASGEDPATNGYLVGVGSDTIQDVEYGISQDLVNETDGTPALSSWTATGTANFLTRSHVTVVAASPAAGQALRPNGSGPGYKALLDSIGATSGVSGFNVGDVDYSRASGTQGVVQTSSASAGVTTDIPFAIDSISTAVPANSPFLLTNDGDGLKISDLVNIYSSQVNEINTTTGQLKAETTPGTVDSGSGFVAIQAFLPKAGSGSRQFFLAQLAALDPTDINLTAGASTKGDGLFPSTTPPATGTPYVGAIDYSGGPVQEHDAQVVTDSTSHSVAAIAPFSAAKFIGYHNGLIADPDTGKIAGTDYALVPFDSSVTGAPATGGVLPYTGDASSQSATLAPNASYQTYAAKGTESASFSLTREVYNIIPTQAWLHPNLNAKYRALTDTFVGKGSKVCLDVNTIKAYGFLPDTSCGSTAKTYGTDATHSGYDIPTITVAHSAAVAGRSSTVTFNVASNGNGGGAFSVTINNKVYAGTIAAGKSSISFSVPTPAAGAISYGGAATDGFTPNLAGVAPAGIARSSFTVAKTTAAVHATAAKVKHTVAGKVAVTVTATGLVPTGKVTVVIKKGSATKQSHSATLSGGKATAKLGKLPKGTYTVYVSYAGNGNVAAKASTKLATLKVS
ncbi:MAG TPA: hypothetical protein VFE15_12275 [Marmoricola sp.]|jgi:hypothetical protein|nr:hypothetical protein [Marmoricola sp.]